ncbi:MAG: DUF1624 domain-containing protein [Bryobacterales bacterium]|nr:DUF1624 domain-containing protein [Bryobacterales bacterium]
MSTPGRRYESVDALRGLIMMIMAIDHASATIARQHGSEFWAGAMSIYNSAFPFLTRWITHLCAPGFFFLMGAGIYWYAASQQGSAVRRTVLRGLTIFALAQVFEGPILFFQETLKPPAVRLSRITAPPPIDGSSLYWGLIVLSTLGLVMMLCGLLLWFKEKPWVWLLVCAASLLITHGMLPADGKPGPLWATLLLTAGLSQHVIVIYPIIPWLGVAAAGMYFGYWWRQNPERASSRVWMVGLAMVAVAVALRAGGGWGNIRPPRDGSWIEFLNNVKYPPSAVFWLMSVGLNLLLLSVLERLPALKAPASPLMVFGQTPLFYYVVHFWTLGLIGFFLFKEAGSLEMAYVVWAVVLVALYPVCRWYRGFKMAKPRESFWRML